MVFGQRILLLIPHPDDEVVGCAAAIGRARANGSRVYGYVLTDGVPAPEVQWPWHRGRHAARVARRRRESETVADRLGLEIAGREDISARRLKENILPVMIRLAAAIYRVRPDVIWAPAYEGGHQDHDVASYIATLLRWRCAVWEFSEYNFAGGRVRSQSFIAPRTGERVIELDAAERREKAGLLSLYASERGNLGYVETRREVFRPLAGDDYTRPPHSGRCFYQRFQWVPCHPRVDYTTPEQVCAALDAFRNGAARWAIPG